MKKNIFLIALTAIIFILMFMCIFGIITSGIGVVITTVLILIFDVVGMILAKKEKVELIYYLMLIFSVITFIILIINIVCAFRVVKAKTFDFQITAISADSEKTKIFTFNDINFYTYNMKDVNCIKKNKKMSLEQALNSGLTLDKIKEAMIPDKKNKDATIYRDGGTEIGNSSYSIVFCNDGSKKGDIIIAPFDYKYKEGICS